MNKKAAVIATILVLSPFVLALLFNQVPALGLIFIFGTIGVMLGAIWMAIYIVFSGVE